MMDFYNGNLISQNSFKRPHSGGLACGYPYESQHLTMTDLDSQSRTKNQTNTKKKKRERKNQTRNNKKKPKAAFCLGRGWLFDLKYLGQS